MHDFHVFTSHLICQKSLIRNFPFPHPWCVCHTRLYVCEKPFVDDFQVQVPLSSIVTAFAAVWPMRDVHFLRFSFLDEWGEVNILSQLPSDDISLENCRDSERTLFLLTSVCAFFPHRGSLESARSKASSDNNDCVKNRCDGSNWIVKSFSLSLLTIYGGRKDFSNGFETFACDGVD